MSYRLSIWRRKIPLTRNLCKIWQGITVEPALVCFILPFYMSSLTIQNLSLEKSCRVNLNLSTIVCDAIQQRNHSGYNEADEIMVQKVVSVAYIWKNVIASVFPTILLLFFGSWSDRNKTRKALMLMPIVGEIISNIGFILCTFFFYELPMEVNTAVEVLPTAITGGSNMMFLGVFTYVSAITSSEERTFRFGIIHTTFCICSAIGTSISGVMYAIIGFYGVFSLSLIVYTIGGFYTYYKVNDDVSDCKKSLTNCELLKDIVNVKKTMDNFRFLVKSNSSAQKKQICAILFLAILVLGPFVGQGAVLYLYTRIKFNWNEVDYSLFSSFHSVAHLVGNFGAITVFSKWLQYDDAILGAISSMSKICGGITYAMATTAVLFYISALLEVFNGIAFVASRSMLTKLVNEEDLGKISSLFGIAESITILIYGPMYSGIYMATIDIFPGSFYVVGVCLTIPAVLIYVWLYTKRNERFSKEIKDPEYRKLLAVHS